MSQLSLTPPLLLNAYVQGIFPMAYRGTIYWFDPDPRAILPLDKFHTPRSLKKVMKRVWIREKDGTARRFRPQSENRSSKPDFEIRINTAFSDVITACGDPARRGGWINAEIRHAYTLLHELGWAHSIEVWQQNTLVGGLYGVALQGLFAGESMYSQVPDASKVALVYVVDRLRSNRFALFDVQFNTPHLARFGVENIPRDIYKKRLREALQIDAKF